MLLRDLTSSNTKNGQNVNLFWVFSLCRCLHCNWTLFVALPLLSLLLFSYLFISFLLSLHLPASSPMSFTHSFPSGNTFISLLLWLLVFIIQCFLVTKFTISLKLKIVCACCQIDPVASTQPIVCMCLYQMLILEYLTGWSVLWVCLATNVLHAETTVCSLLCTHHSKCHFIGKITTPGSQFMAKRGESVKTKLHYKSFIWQLSIFIPQLSFPE